MARPVAIIRSSDLTMVSSPPTPLTPPSTNLSSPHHQDHNQDAQQQQQQQHQTHMSENNHSPPESPQAQMERKGLSRISSPYATSRDYAFNHFHSQQPQVQTALYFECEIHPLIAINLQLFSYPSSISTMSGVISPTNLSLYSSPVTTPRTTPRTRWNNPFLMEEDFGMMSHPVSSNNPDSVILMEEGRFWWI